MEKMKDRFTAEKELLIDEWKTNLEAVRAQLKEENYKSTQEWKASVERAKTEKEEAIQELKASVDRTRDQAKMDRETVVSDWREQIRTKEATINDLSLKVEFIRVCLVEFL